ncbi:hypothetical protein HMPREF9370_0101 [Neisseria wadsworthii 9715]|uniref:Uncharacterized protein n=2 Tax=Neisseria TaxID=482 RepID=G4CLZ2_9NEIS|nr:hypothetical protein HMPREF9370_0101 [Neisseria wadsworthii 9715]
MWNIPFARLFNRLNIKCYFGAYMNTKESILKPGEQIMFAIVLIALFLMFYFASGYSFLNSALLSAGFTLISLTARITMLKLAKKMHNKKEE